MRWTFLATLGLAGCAVGSDMDAGLGALVGHDVKDVVHVLGYPTSQVQVAGDTVYTWDSALQLAPQYWCQVRVVAEADKVKTYGFSGSSNGCRPSARALTEYVEKVKAKRG